MSFSKSIFLLSSSARTQNSMTINLWFWTNLVSIRRTTLTWLCFNVAKAGAISKFGNLLRSKSIDVAKQFVWTLGNIAGNGATTGCVFNIFENVFPIENVSHMFCRFHFCVTSFCGCRIYAITRIRQRQSIKLSWFDRHWLISFSTMMWDVAGFCNIRR